MLNVRLQFIFIVFALTLFSVAFRVRVRFPSSRVYRGLSLKDDGHNGIIGYSQQCLNCIPNIKAIECPGEVKSEAVSSFEPFERGLAARALFIGSVLGSSVSRAWAEGNDVIAREDVGFLSLNETEPIVTDIAYLDIQIGDSAPQRVEIHLYGMVCPQTVANFKSLCIGQNGNSYVGSEVFRVISTFSIQAGNIGCPPDAPRSRIGRYGKAASEPFSPENMRILHDSPDGGVVSMMKDLTNKGKQDSRFFITTSPAASWADNKYTAFGKVSKGLDFIKGMQVLPVVAPANYPETTIKIVKAGIL